MKQQCEDRLKYFETGEKPPKNVDVMHDALQESLVLQQQVILTLHFLVIARLKCVHYF